MTKTLLTLRALKRIVIFMNAFYKRLQSKFYSKTLITQRAFKRIDIFMNDCLVVNFFILHVYYSGKVKGYKLQYKLHVTTHKSQVASCKLQITSHKLKLQVTNYKLQFTSYKLQVFSVQLFWHFKHWNGLTLLCTVLAGTVKLKVRVNFEWQSLLVACTLLLLG